MRYFTLAAGAVLAATAALHVFAGGPEIHQPIQGSALSAPLRAISAVLWHTVTALIVICAVALMWCSRHRNPALEWVILALNLSFAGLFLFYGLTLLGNISEMPQWVLFVLPSALMMISWRRDAHAHG